LMSTLLAENLALAHLLHGDFDRPTQAVLFDPQTSGGLLAGIPSDRASDCIAELRANGYRHASIIGRVVATGLPASAVAVTVSRRLKHWDAFVDGLSPGQPHAPERSHARSFIREHR
jgi:selenide, water dikinase